MPLGNRDKLGLLQRRDIESGGEASAAVEVSLYHGDEFRRSFEEFIRAGYLLFQCIKGLYQGVGLLDVGEDLIKQRIEFKQRIGINVDLIGVGHTVQ